MITGAFAFLLFLFSSPQAVLTRSLSGTWEVVADSTDSYRPFWRKIYAFEKCDDPREMACLGSYGFVDEPDVLTNLLDKSYFVYGVSKEKEDGHDSRILFIDHQAYFFELSESRNVLLLLDENKRETLRMVRRN